MPKYARFLDMAEKGKMAEMPENTRFFDDDKSFVRVPRHSTNQKLERLILLAFETFRSVICTSLAPLKLLIIVGSDMAIKM